MAIKSLINKPIIGPVVKLLVQFLASREAKRIAKHFSEFLLPLEANKASLKKQVFKIRHNVYCEELKFEPTREDKQELDEFDIHSFHCLIQHRSSGRFAGTVRIVYSRNQQELLPLEQYCLDSIDHPTLTPQNFPRHSICEISRLAVPSEFRRRQADKFDGAATGAINETTYSETELRCFPFIAVGLYLSAANIVINRGIEHAFVMMEPRLARSLKFVGIEFQQIGPVVNYHGKRAPYYISPEILKQRLSPGFKALFKSVEKELRVDEQGDNTPLKLSTCIDIN